MQLAFFEDDRPASLRQGQGQLTALKERGIAAAVSVSLRMASRLPDFTYWHADLNCGSGFNELAQCAGSPLVFVREAVQQRRQNFRALFCDHDEAAVVKLQSALGEHPNCYCLPWENRLVLPVLAEWICKHERNPQFAFGSVLVDPNGYFDEATVPHKQLIEFAHRFPRIDLIFNLNVRTYRLSAPHVLAGRGKWSNKFLPSPRQLPAIFARRHWLIREVMSKGGDPFVLLIGRNLRANDHTSMSMFHMDSARGQEILDAIDPPAKAASELAPLPHLFGLSEASAFQSNQGSGDEQCQLDL